MKLLKLGFYLFITLLSDISYSQDPLTPDEAYEQYKNLREDLISFDDLNDKNFEEYFQNYLKQLDVVPYLTDNPLTQLQFYANYAHNYTLLELYEEVIRLNLIFHEHFKNQPESVYEDYPPFKEKKATYELGTLALAYAKLNKLDSAQWAHQEALTYKNDIDTIFKASVHNNYGLFFLNDKRQVDNALEQFRIAESIMLDYDDEDYFYGSIRDNIADAMLEKGNRIEARQIYLDNFNFYENTRQRDREYIDYKRFYKAGYQYIEQSIALNKTDSIKNILDRMAVHYQDVSSHFLNLDAHITFLKTKEMVMLYYGNTNEAYAVAREREKIINQNEKITNDFKQDYKNVINANTINNLRSNFQLEKKRQTEKINTQRLEIYLISICSILFIGFLSFLYYRRKKRLEYLKNQQHMVEQNLLISKLHNERLSDEIEAKRRDLSDFAINLNQSQEWAKNLSKKVEDIKRSKGRKRGNLMKELESEIDNKLKFDNNYKIFYERLEELNNEFFLKLNKRYPNLSKTDKRLCSLIRLKMNSNDIAILQNITVSSLNTSRYRLRKKLELKEDEDLDYVIQNL